MVNIVKKQVKKDNWKEQYIKKNWMYIYSHILNVPVIFFHALNINKKVVQSQYDL